MMSLRAMVFVLLLGSGLALIRADAADAGVIKVHYQALENVLGEKFFTRQGQYFLYGAAASDCNSALLENPRVSGKDGRLRITADFRGRAGMEVLGECKGTADAFVVEMTGVPVYRDGVLALSQAQVKTPYPLYNDVLGKVFTGGMAAVLRYPLLAELKKAAAEASRQNPFRLQVDSLQVASIETDGDHFNRTYAVDASLASIQTAADHLLVNLDFALQIE